MRSNALSSRNAVKSRAMELIYEENEFRVHSYPYRSYSSIRDNVVCLCSWSFPLQPACYASCSSKQPPAMQPSSALIYDAQSRMPAPCYSQPYLPWVHTGPGIPVMPAPSRPSPIFVTVATQTQDIPAAIVMGPVTHDTARQRALIAASGQTQNTSSSSSSSEPLTSLTSSSSSSSSVTSSSSVYSVFVVVVCLFTTSSTAWSTDVVVVIFLLSAFVVVHARASAHLIVVVVFIFDCRKAKKLP